VTTTFDIFKVVGEGPLWITDVQGLREAKERIVHLGLTSPGEYFIYSPEEGVVARRCSPMNGPTSSDALHWTGIQGRQDAIDL
jgi:hypothetical protein